MKNKVCLSCQTTKPVEQFHIDRKNRDGRCTRCAVCKNNKKKVSIHSKPQKILSTPVSIHLQPKELYRVLSPKEQHEQLNRLHEETRKQRLDFDEMTETKVMSVPQKIEVTTENIGELNEVCASLIFKHNRHFNLTVDRQGKAKITFHGSPTLVFQGVSVQEVVDQALAY